MTMTPDTLTTVSIGVPRTAHSVTTSCPSCQHEHTVVLVSSDAEGDVLRKALERLGEVSSARASYRTPSAPRVAKELRQVSPRPALRATTHDRLETVTTRPATVRQPTRPRFRYFASDRRKNPVVLSPTRRRIYRVIEKLTERGRGALAVDLTASFPHGTVQQTLHWLRANGWVRYEEESATAVPA